MIALGLFLFVLFPAPMTLLSGIAAVFGEWTPEALAILVAVYLIACAADTSLLRTGELP